MNKVRQAALVLLVLLPAAACRRPAERDWTADLQPIQDKYAPDTRLAVFRIEVSGEPGKLVAEGEVDDPAAKAEVLARLAERAGMPVTDRVAVLPDPGLAGEKFGIVTVSVGNLRRAPRHSAEMLSQVLMGAVVRLLKRDGGWLYVKCADRYLGWIDDDAMAVVDAGAADGWNAARRIVVTTPSAVLLERPGQTAAQVSDLVAGDLLRWVAGRGPWFEAALPDGRTGFVAAAAAQEYSAWKSTRRLTAEGIEKTARMFLGVPYLWGGTSAKGFDCSGFVKTVYQMNGLDLLRDANQQARLGRGVDPAGLVNLKRGDLLFFGRKAGDGKPERIWHVGLYLSDGAFIHCSGRVRIASLDPRSPTFDRDRAETFVRATRLVDSTETPRSLNLR